MTERLAPYPSPIYAHPVPPIDGRWCGCCGGEMNHWRRYHPGTQTIQTFVVCWACRSFGLPTLAEPYVMGQPEETGR